MKILFHHRTGSKDGQAVHIEELTGALRRRGHEVLVIGPPALEEAAFGGQESAVALMKRALPKAAYELMELAYAGLAYRRLRAAYLRFRPDVLYERYNLFQPAGLWLKRRFDLPLLLEVNAPLAFERGRVDGLALPRLARWSEETVWRGADRVLPVTGVLADFLRSAGVPEERITVLPNGIDPRSFAAAPDRDAAKQRLGLAGSLVLGFTGFMRDWHGLERAIDALAHSDPALAMHLLLVGDGPARAGLEHHARACGVSDRVTITGVVGRAAIADHIAAFDIALQPAVMAYASPLKIFEYMALGRAIIAPDTANIREILRDGESALLFDPDDPGAFAAAIARAVSDGDLRTRLGAAAAAAIDTQGLTWDRNAARIEGLFRQLLEDSPPPHRPSPRRPPPR